jgi:hypothetical protein
MLGIEQPDIVELVVIGVALLMVQAGIVKHLLARRAPHHARRPRNVQGRR